MLLSRNAPFARPDRPPERPDEPSLSCRGSRSANAGGPSGAGRIVECSGGETAVGVTRAEVALRGRRFGARDPLLGRRERYGGG